MSTMSRYIQCNMLWIGKRLNSFVSEVIGWENLFSEKEKTEIRIWVGESEEPRKYYEGGGGGRF